MRIRNLHERIIHADAGRLGALLDGLGSETDRLWPREHWPAMRFDRPLAEGAAGGHGPIRYFVAAYRPGQAITFVFTAPRGFQGQHCFEIEPAGEGQARLRHVLAMVATGPARLSWPLVFRPLHDALVEDAFDQAERQLGLIPGPRRWGLWVRVLRRLLGRSRDRRKR